VAEKGLLLKATDVKMGCNFGAKIVALNDKSSGEKTILSVLNFFQSVES
jgi:hypothetical protein